MSCCSDAVRAPCVWAKRAGYLSAKDGRTGRWNDEDDEDDEDDGGIGERLAADLAGLLDRGAARGFLLDLGVLPEAAPAW